VQSTLWPHDTTKQGPMDVAVNVSARQLEPGSLPAAVQDILARSGLAPRCLHLELTETAIMDLDPEILGQLSRIRDLGVQIGLDDFGTGCGSLTHLRRLPLDFVKVDRSFVNGLGHDRGDERIVSAVIDLACNLGLRSIAEGVETIEQLSQLRALAATRPRATCSGVPLRRKTCASPPLTLSRQGSLNVDRSGARPTTTGPRWPRRPHGASSFTRRTSGYRCLSCSRLTTEREHRSVRTRRGGKGSVMAGAL
jgi:predicted signal transduction protein with EAL and GGDEF domain